MAKSKAYLALIIVFCSQFAIVSPVQAATCLEAANNAELTNFDFSGCDLTEARFSGTDDLSGANFTNANLTRASLQGKNFTGANFTGANLTTADMRNANITGANFTRANFTGARVTDFFTLGGVRHAANFSGSNLTGANLYRCQVQEADFTNANLTGTNFAGCAMSNVKGTGISGKPVGLSSLTTIVNRTISTKAIVLASMTGTPIPGKALQANHSNYYDPTTIWTYQWFRYAVAIPKATKSSYVLTPDDCDTQIKVIISGTVQTFSIHDAPVITVPRCVMKPVAPKLSGTPKSKQTIKATVSAWIKGAEVTYQWLLDGLPIEGATSSKFSILPSHKKHKISLIVTQTRQGYETATATSTALKIL